MQLLNLGVLLFSLTCLEQVAAQIPRDFVPVCAHKCLHKSVPSLCPHSVGFLGLRQCLCKEKKSDQLREELEPCLKTHSDCTKLDIQKIIKFTHTICEAPIGPPVSTSSSSASPTPTSTSAQSGQTTPASQAQTPGADHKDGGSSTGLSPGATAGIGVAVAVGVLAIVAVVGCMFFRRRRRAQQEHEQRPQTYQDHNIHQPHPNQQVKHWSQDYNYNNNSSDPSRAELGGPDVSMTHGRFFEGSPNTEAPPAYVHEKEGVVPISELASPTEVSPSNYGSMSQVHELPSPPDTVHSRGRHHRSG